MVGTFLSILPLFVFILYVLRIHRGIYLKKIPQIVCVSYLLVMAFLLAAVPVNDSYDRENYAQEYLGLTSEREIDIAWMFYCRIVYAFVGSNVFIFFFITSMIYCFSYFYYFKKLVPTQNIGYMIILLTGSLGFAGYGYNTIRAGLAISWTIIALSIHKNLFFKFIFLITSVLTHFSLILPILSYFLSTFIKKKEFIEIAWLICIFLSLIQIDFMSVFSYFSDFDVRIVKFTDGDDMDYQISFRWDFLLYSIIPVYLSSMWMRKYHYYSRFYERIYKTFLLSNSFWLLAMRIPYTDRIAYLSWFMIPILVLYPVVSGDVKLNKAQTMVIRIIGIFIGINVILSLRS